LARDTRPIALPDGFGPIVGIYPLASAYQTAAVEALELAVVGDARENEALFVEIRP
jgi:hypothetical protein